MQVNKSLFISFDGPNGVGKSTIVQEISSLLSLEGYDVFLTKEPTNSHIGSLIRNSEELDSLRGKPLACLIAADRHAHIQAEIKPNIQQNKLVITDRYIPSSLALQNMDGVSMEYIWNINEGFLYPDILFFIYADETNILTRMEYRSHKTRFEREYTPLQELEFFKKAEKYLSQQGLNCISIQNNEGSEQAVNEVFSIIQNY